MSENLHDIDKLFHDSIEEHAEPPSADVWNELDKNLDKINISTIQKKYRRLKQVAILLFLLLTATVLYEIQSKHSTKEQRGANNIDPGKTSSPTSQLAPSKNTVTPPVGPNKTTTTEVNIPTNSDPGTKIPTETNTKQARPTQPISAIKNDKDERNNGNTNGLYKRSNSLFASSGKLKVSVTSPEPLSDPENNTVDGAGNEEMLKSWLSPSTVQVDKLAVERTWRQTDLSIKDKDPMTEISSPTNTSKSTGIKNAGHFHFAAGISLSRFFSSDRIEDDHKDGRHNDRNAIKQNEQKQTAYSLGLSLDIPLGKKIALQSGVTLLSKKTDIAPQKIYAKLDNDGNVKYEFNCSSGYSYIAPKAGTAPAVGDSINTSASTSSLKYVNIPLSVKYNFNIGKFSIGPIIGASVNILAKQKTQTGLANGNSFDKQTIDNIQGLKHSYFNGFGGISLDYNLNKKISVNVTPSGNVALSSINKNSSVKSYANGLGASAGVKIKF